jgi:hypothetical protein
VGEFFKGWRRKLGLVTLAIACLAAVGWTRSYVVADTISVDLFWQQYVMISVDGSFAWDWYPSDSAGLRYERRIIAKKVAAQHRNDMLFNAPYWPFVLPLTLICAWLILVRPRKAKPEPSVPINSHSQEGSA